MFWIKSHTTKALKCFLTKNPLALYGSSGFFVLFRQTKKILTLEKF
jgi:hypothetical protein